MKPRTKREKEILSLARQLPPLSRRQTEWAKSLHKPQMLYKRRGKIAKCLACGKRVDHYEFLTSDIDTGEYWCPECGRCMETADWSASPSLTDCLEVGFITTFRGRQVIRVAHSFRHNQKGDIPAKYDIYEAYQVWIDPDGKETLTGHRHHRSPFSSGFHYDSPLEIKAHNASLTGYYQMDDMFDTSGIHLYPRARVTPAIRQRGWNKRWMTLGPTISIVEILRALQTDPLAESIAKHRQADLLRDYIRRGPTRWAPFRHCVRIAMRHRYDIYDAALWFDMLTSLEQLRLDTHSPAYICPPDLPAAHDIMTQRVARLLARRDAKDAAMTDKEWRLRYIREKSPWFGIRLTSPDIVIEPIKTVLDIYNEGKAMHHCVYTNKYYQKPDSLLLSARTPSGQRVETVELDLRRLQVLQSRAKFNKTSPLHDKIINLINSNIHLFRIPATGQPAPATSRS